MLIRCSMVWYGNADDMHNILGNELITDTDLHLPRMNKYNN